MNFCKQCGKEIDDKHKFCNRSCSAKYNNVHRSPIHWSVEKRKAFSRRQIIANGHDPDNLHVRSCKYCGKEVDTGFVCNDCRPYTKFSSIVRKLGFQSQNGQTLKEQYTLAIDYLAELYNSGESTLTLEQKFGIPKETVWYNLKKFKGTRTLSEAVKTAILQGRYPEDIKGNPKYAHGWHRNWQGFDGFYRSSYELGYAQELDNSQIPYRIEYLPTFTEYYDTQKQRKRIARPDFYLPNSNEIVEIKSKYTFNEQEMRDKFKAYRERGFNPKLILDGKELVL